VERLTVKDGRLVLPSGMSYRVLVLPNLKTMSLEAARKVRQLVRAGATVVGPKPEQTTGQQDVAELRRIAAELWDSGKITTRSAREALALLQVAADVEGIPDWIHRRTDDADIYFLSNQQPQGISGDVTFRIAGKQPELWDAVSGSHRDAAAFTQRDGRTTVPLEFPPYGSLFVVFRKDATGNGAGRNFPTFAKVADISGTWQVHFEPKWGGPASVRFDELISWTRRSEDGIKFYSGTATYRKTFDLGSVTLNDRLFLDLGDLRNLAEVRLNGRRAGIVWTPPFRVDITGMVKATGNVLEIDVVNTWYNRLIKDLTLPPGERLTKTNIRLKPGTTPADSGLLGPVTLQMSTADRHGP